MVCCNISTPMMMIMAVVILGSMTSSTKAQTTQDCAQDLAPCVDYLNSTATPSNSCCTVIKKTVDSQLPCLCNLFFTPGILASLGSNTTKALRIATACGVDADVDAACKAVLAPTNSPPTTPAQPGGDGDSGSGRIAWIGFPALLLFWASVMNY